MMRARFEPKVLDTLRPHLVPLIGHEGEWELAFRQDEGPYAGQNCYYLDRGDPRYRETRAKWVPAEDLVPV